MNQQFKFKTAQNSKNLRLNGHTSFESQMIILVIDLNVKSILCQFKPGKMISDA